MASESTLILLTNSFPLGRGEEFLEAEMPYLTRSFDRVVVVPTRVGADTPMTREVAGNVQVVRVGQPRPTGRSAWLALARGLTQLQPDLVDADTRRNPRLLVSDARFEAEARSVADAMLAELPHLGLGPGSHVSVYSFWLHVPARVGDLLVRDLRARGVNVDRFVSRAHRYDLYADRAPRRHIPQRRHLLEVLDAIHPVSEHGSRALRSAWPAHADKISTRHLGTRDPGALTALSREPFHVLTCSHLSAVKRVDRMPAVLAGLRSRGIDAHWTHIGDGPTMPDLRSAIDAADIDEHVTLLGHVAQSDLVATEKNLGPSVFVNLSSSEGLPVSMMEIASLGIPIVATDVGGVSEIVTADNGRLLSDDPTSGEVVDALAELAALPQEEWQAMSRSARSRWHDDFDAEVVYPAFCRDVLGGR